MNSDTRDADRSGMAAASRILASIIENSDDAIVTKNLDGVITTWNAAAQRLFGYPAAEAVGQPVVMLIPDDHHDEEPSILARIRRGERVAPYDTVRRHKDGRLLDISITVSPIVDDDGRVIGASKIARDITARKRAEARLRDSEARYRSIFESVRVGLWEEDFSAVLDMFDDLRGRGVGDLRAWLADDPRRLSEVLGRIRIVDVNERAVELFGAGGKDDLRRRRNAVFVDGAVDTFVDELVTVWEGGRRFDGEAAVLTLDGRRLDLAVSIAFGGERYERTLVSMLDMTDRVAAERDVQKQKQRFETLNSFARTISTDLELESVVQTVTDFATEVSGAEFGAFFYNVTDGNGESYLLYTLSGASPDAFEKIGLPRNTPLFEATFRGTATIRCDDVRTDPRYGLNPPHHGMPEGHLPVVSYLAVPVASASGGPLGGLFFGHSEPGVFSAEAQRLIEGIAAHAAIAIDNARLHRAAREEVEQRRRAEEAKELLLREISHRVKNTLVTVQAIAAQTFRDTSRDRHDAFSARIRALGGAHDLLTDRFDRRAAVGEVISRSLEPFREPGRDRFRISGPDARVEPDQAVLLAMALHELATNAVKYGALSADTGYVHIDWQRAELDDGRSMIELGWRENGGPNVVPPERKGFGLTLLERAAGGLGGEVRIDFAPSGVSCDIAMAVAGDVADPAASQP